MLIKKWIVKKKKKMSPKKIYFFSIYVPYPLEIILTDKGKGGGGVGKIIQVTYISIFLFRCKKNKQLAISIIQV